MCLSLKYRSIVLTAVILALGATASPQTAVQFVTLKPDALNQVPTHHRARIADRLELYVRSTNAVDLDQIYALMPRSCTEGLERTNWRKQVHVDSRGLLRAFYVDEVYPGEYTFPAKVDGEKWIANGCGTYQRGDKAVKFKASIKLVLAGDEWYICGSGIAIEGKHNKPMPCDGT